MPKIKPNTQPDNGRLYLNLIGRLGSCDYDPDRDGDRAASFLAARAKYGFYPSDIWSLDYTMIELLYERLCFFRDTPGVSTSLRNPVKIGKKCLSQGEWMDKLIGWGEEVLRDDGVCADDRIRSLYIRIWRVWSKLQFVMWT